MLRHDLVFGTRAGRQPTVQAGSPDVRGESARHQDRATGYAKRPTLARMDWLPSRAQEEAPDENHESIAAQAPDAVPPAQPHRNEDSPIDRQAKTLSGT